MSPSHLDTCGVCITQIYPSGPRGFCISFPIISLVFTAKPPKSFSILCWHKLLCHPFHFSSRHLPSLNSSDTELMLPSLVSMQLKTVDLHQKFWIVSEQWKAASVILFGNKCPISSSKSSKNLWNNMEMGGNFTQISSTQQNVNPMLLIPRGIEAEVVHVSLLKIAHYPTYFIFVFMLVPHDTKTQESHHTTCDRRSFMSSVKVTGIPKRLRGKKKKCFNVIAVALHFLLGFVSSNHLFRKYPLNMC